MFTRQDRENAFDSLESWLAEGCPHVRVVNPQSQEATDIVGFNMNYWMHYGEDIRHTSTPNPPDCGTVCCMGGYLEQVAPEGDWLNKNRPFYWLFYPYYISSNWEDITPAQALAVLRNYRSTGEIDWSIIE